MPCLSSVQISTSMIQYCVSVRSFVHSSIYMTISTPLDSNANRHVFPIQPDTSNSVHFPTDAAFLFSLLSEIQQTNKVTARMQQRGFHECLAGNGWFIEQSLCNTCRKQRENHEPELPVHEFRRREDGQYNLRKIPRIDYKKAENGRWIEPSPGQAKVQSRLPKGLTSKPKVPEGQSKVQGKLPSPKIPLGSLVPKSQGQYTFGDAFCGAGGMSRGAMMAGFRLKWAFDNDEQTIIAFRKNFSEEQTASFNLGSKGFISLLPENWKAFNVDVIHFSPPCQPWSTRTSRKAFNNPQNVKRRECLSAIKPILERIQPRIATLETVPGILCKRHEDYFRSIIDTFESLGYKVRWKKLNCAELGLAQSRLRVFLIASR